jgi:hypothetical protein|tara:strand:+ start:287 stop:469 length:183 start_codon:yes stop_codon:yes gene_type:complete
MMKCRGMGRIKPVALKKGGSTKDACYHKVKSRYKVFPSAYASGAIAKCRKVGAKNWGNKS